MTHRLVAILCSLTVALGLALMPLGSADAAPVVRFTRVYVNSPGADNGSNTSLNAEWIRVKNFGSRPKVLTGWTIRDPQGHVFRFPAFTLRPGAIVNVHTGTGRNTATNLYWRSARYVWNNGGDRAILRSRAGVRVDTCSWRSVRSAVNC